MWYFLKVKKSFGKESSHSRIPRLVLHPKDLQISEIPLSEDESKDCNINRKLNRTISPISFSSGVILKFKKMLHNLVLKPKDWIVGLGKSVCINFCLQCWCVPHWFQMTLDAQAVCIHLQLNSDAVQTTALWGHPYQRRARPRSRGSESVW